MNPLAADDTSPILRENPHGGTLMVRRLIGVMTVVAACSISSARGSDCPFGEGDENLPMGYSVQCVHLPPGFENYFPYLWDINAHGQVVGRLQRFMGEGLPGYSFKWDPTSGFHLISNDGYWGTATSINDAGQVVGCYFPTEFDEPRTTSVGWIWDQENGRRDFVTPDAGFPVPMSINNNGLVVGFADLTDYGQSHGELYISTDGATYPPIGNSPFVSPLDVNNSGLIAGHWQREAARWTIDGESEILRLPIEEDYIASGVRIADDGTTLIYATTTHYPQQSSLAVALPDGTIVDLGPLPISDRIYDMNSEGEVIYLSRDSGFVLWSPEAGFAPFIPYPWIADFAKINDSGVIVMAEEYESVMMILTPIPTPASIALICCALPVVILRRAR
ncbi:MAG: hypothetical protein R3B46_02240 [Phycisphaerales bacterium]